MLTKKLGAAETKEIVAELRSVEAGIDALDTRAESVGGTAPALDAAAAPLVARIDAVKQLVELTRGRIERKVRENGRGPVRRGCTPTPAPPRHAALRRGAGAAAQPRALQPGGLSLSRRGGGRGCTTRHPLAPQNHSL